MLATVGFLLLLMALVVPLIVLFLPDPAKVPRGVAFGVLVVWFNAAGVVVLGCDYLLAATVWPRFTWGAAGIAVLVALGAYRAHRIPLTLWLAGLFVAALLALAWSDWTPRKPFRRFYNQVAPGMNLSELRAALGREFRAGGAHPVPVERSAADGSGISFILDPARGAYNSEIVFVELRDGRVVRKHYSAD